MKPRDYQERFIDAAWDQLTNGKISTLGAMATGLGKTVVFVHFAHRWHREKFTRVLILAHREELIFQAAGKVEELTGVRPDIEMAEMLADQTGLYTDSPIVVSSVQTLCRPNRLNRFDPEDFGLVIVDEAHHCVPKNKSYYDILTHFLQNPRQRLLGVTATPDRADEEALGQVFESVCFEYDILAGITAGWLVPIAQQFIRVDALDLREVRSKDGDLIESDLSRVVGEERVLHEICSATFEAAKGRPTLVFMPGRKRGESGASPMMRAAEFFNGLKTGCCDFISGDERETPKEKRRELIEAYRKGRLQILVSCGVFTEGFDAPNTAVIAMARPTKSRAFYAQCIGRGTRPLPGIVDEWSTPPGRLEAIAQSTKPTMTVLDFVGNSGRHKLITSADLLGGKVSEAAAERAVAEAKEAGKPVDMLAALEEMEHRIHEEKKAERQRRLVAKVQYTATTVDPFDVFDITPTREPGWHKGRKPTDKMFSYAQKLGLPINDDSSFWEVKQLLDEVTRRRDEGLCSFKMARTLNRHGYDGTNMGFEEAKQALNALAANGWRRPVDAGGPP